LDSSENITQALGELSLTDKKVEKFSATLTKMEESKIKEDNAYLAEVQENFKLMQQIQKYEDHSIIIEMLVEERHNIWHNINANVTKLWPSIQIIFEQKDLV